MIELNQLKDLGVKEFTVKDNEARAVNPYLGYIKNETGEEEDERFIKYRKIANLPPLPTSGIPDGRIGIDEVEPVQQGKVLDVWTDLPLMQPEQAIEHRTALRRKTKEEVNNYEYAFSVHYKAIENKTLSRLLESSRRIVMDFTESEFNEFRIQCMLLTIELCEIERNIKPDIEHIL